MIKDEIDRETDAPEQEVVEIVEDEALSDAAPKSPWKAFILTGLIASVFGAAGGGYGVYAGLKAQSPQVSEVTPVDLTPLETRLKTLTDRVAAAEASVKQIKNRPAPKAVAAQEPIALPDPVDLSPLEDRLKALESAPKPEIDPKALTALQSAQKDGFEWPDTSALEDRLSSLETEFETQSDALAQRSKDSGSTDEALTNRIKTLEAQLKTLDEEATERAAALEDASKLKDTSKTAPVTPAVSAQRVNKIEARVTALENKPAPETRVPVLAFPKAAMVAAIEDNVEGGLFKRVLSKHVRVKDEDDPLGLIELIEADIVAGRLESAIMKYDRLPDGVRAAGQAWYESVKASL